MPSWSGIAVDVAQCIGACPPTSVAIAASIASQPGASSSGTLERPAAGDRAVGERPSADARCPGQFRRKKPRPGDPICPEHVLLACGASGDYVEDEQSPGAIGIGGSR